MPCICSIGNLNHITLANHTAVLAWSWGAVFTYSRQQAWSRSWLWTVGIWGGTGWWSTPGSNSHTVSCSCRCRATDTLALKTPYNELNNPSTTISSWYSTLTFLSFLLVLQCGVAHRYPEENLTAKWLLFLRRLNRVLSNVSFKYRFWLRCCI